MITKITYNWRQEGNLQGGIGEDYDYEEVGKNSVKEIIEHPARGEGDRWHYDVIHDDGSVLRIFNPNSAVMTEIQN